MWDPSYPRLGADAPNPDPLELLLCWFQQEKGNAGTVWWVPELLPTSRTVREAEGKSGDVFPSSPGTHTHPRGLAVVSELLSGCFKFRILQAQDKWQCPGAGMGQGICSDCSCSSCSSSTRSAALCISTSPVTSLLLLLSHQELQDLGGDILILGEEKKW